MDDGEGSLGRPCRLKPHRQPCEQGADDLDLPALRDRIEKEMPKAMPEVQWTMNSTLGAIGIQHTKLAIP